MPTRILLRLFFLAGLLASGCAFALGVGQLEVRSALNQTFEAELPLITSNPAELAGLVAQIPRQEEFDRVGVERLEFLSKLRFSVQTPPGGRSVVRVTSLEPVREPNFNLLLELVWPRGRMIREFTVQLDPELYANRQPPPPPPPIVAPPPPVVAPPPVAAASPAPLLPPAPPVSFEGASLYGPVRTGETLMAIANRVRPSAATGLPQMMAILVAGNPAAFVDGNPNALRAGATLKVPTPQALGAVTPASKLAAAPAVAGPTAAPAPVDRAFLSPSPASELASPPSAAEPGTPPPPIATAPLPATPVAELTPPAAPGSTSPPLSAEQPQEIVPRATIPQPEAPLPAAAPPVAAPETAAAPPAAPPVAAPETAAAPPAALPATQPSAPPPAEAEAEPGWMNNPVVWIAIALIALAIAALILLPLLRRPARIKPPVVEAVAPESREGEPTTVTEPPPSEPKTRRTHQLSEPIPGWPRPAASEVATTATPDRVKSAPGPTSAPMPKPIGELLKDFDFGLGEGALPPAVAARQGAAPTRDIKAPLFEAELPTAPVTRPPASPFAETPTDREEPAKQREKEKEKESPASPPVELPHELRLDGLDFDFGDLGLDTIARPQPPELPPLEMKPGAAGTRKPSGLPPLEMSIAEPATEPPSLVPSAAVPAGPAMPDLKFEFADVTQEMAKQGAHEDALKLDEALQGLGGDTLKVGSQPGNVRGVSVRGADSTDYVETKLDLASAYLDMDDYVGARGLLEEVLREGNAAQKERAGEFLKKLG